MMEQQPDVLQSCLVVKIAQWIASVFLISICLLGPWTNCKWLPTHLTASVECSTP